MSDINNLRVDTLTRNALLRGTFIKADSLDDLTKVCVHQLLSVPNFSFLRVHKLIVALHEQHGLTVAPCRVAMMRVEYIPGNPSAHYGAPEHHKLIGGVWMTPECDMCRMSGYPNDCFDHRPYGPTTWVEAPSPDYPEMTSYGIDWVEGRFA